jgi:L-2-hydroxyglutarate oxidase
MAKTYDVLVVGAGIVGLATAYRLLEKRPSLKLAVVDKENRVAAHQSGHNSGVIHSGIYYRPGSLRARYCISGYKALLPFCDEQGVPYEICGKLIVATREAELPRLEAILQHGRANGLAGIRRIGPEEARAIEPNVRTVAALRVLQTGIMDYVALAEAYRRLIESRGAQVLLGSAVREVRRNHRLEVIAEDRTIRTRLLINCAGLYADEIARLTLPGHGWQILPFRGEYYSLTPEGCKLVKHLIYPVPDPDFPFLGEHFTRLIHGGVEAGPNAVLAFAREGYHRTIVNWRELAGTLTYPGFRRLAVRHWRQGLMEQYRSWSKPAFVRQLQKLVPAVRSEHLQPGGAGVRAVLCSRKGELSDDFVIEEGPAVVNVLNAPSPAATASLAVGQHIADRALTQIGD